MISIARRVFGVNAVVLVAVSVPSGEPGATVAVPTVRSPLIIPPPLRTPPLMVMPAGAEIVPFKVVDPCV